MSTEMIAQIIIEILKEFIDKFIARSRVYLDRSSYQNLFGNSDYILSGCLASWQRNS